MCYNCSCQNALLQLYVEGGIVSTPNDDTIIDYWLVASVLSFERQAVEFIISFLNI